MRVPPALARGWLYTVRYMSVWGVFGIWFPTFAHMIGELLVNIWLRLCYRIGVWAGQMPFWLVLRPRFMGVSLVVEPPLALAVGGTDDGLTV